MISSFGENELTVNSWIVGKVRVLNVHQGSALYPRLTLLLGVQLQENPGHEFAPGRPIKAFEMRDLRGEVRLEEGGKAVGLLEWFGQRRHVRSAAHVFETQIEAVCNLDWSRLDAIEEYRAGKEPTLWVALWPTLVDGSGFLDCGVNPIRTQVPRDRWIEVLGQLTGLRRTLVEVVLPNTPSSEFRAALGHIAEARSRVDRGDFDEAVSGCRRAIESLLAALNIRNDAEVLEEHLARVTDARRAKAYAGIVSRLKEFGNFAIHRPEAPGRYVRAEAQFVVAVTSYTVALLAALLRSDVQ